MASKYPTPKHSAVCNTRQEHDSSKPGAEDDDERRRRGAVFWTDGAGVNAQSTGHSKRFLAVGLTLLAGTAGYSSLDLFLSEAGNGEGEGDDLGDLAFPILPQIAEPGYIVATDDIPDRDARAHFAQAGDQMQVLPDLGNRSSTIDSVINLSGGGLRPIGSEFIFTEVYTITAAHADAPILQEFTLAEASKPVFDVVPNVLTPDLPAELVRGTLWATPNADFLDASGFGVGHDIYALESDDTVVGSRFDDLISGGTGSDTLIGGDGNDTLEGDEGNDTLEGGNGDDTLSGGDADDTLSGGNGNDTLNGNDGADILNGGAGDDNLSGDAGDDTLDGGDGHDTLSGGGGRDTLSGGAGNDTLFGGDAPDTLTGGAGEDSLSGGAGNDILNGGIGDDTLSGGNQRDTLNGGAGDDTLFGDDGNDAMNGGAGNDTLIGGSGFDVMDGGAGDDIFRGGTQPDFATGGDGADIFEFVYGVDDSLQFNGRQRQADYFDGGQGGQANGWVDSIQFSGVNGGPNLPGGDWTLSLWPWTGTIVTQNADSIVFSDDTDGFIVFADGGRLDFENLEMITW